MRQNREIKYKAWDGTQNAPRFCEWEELKKERAEVIFIPFNREVFIHRYTGFNDKNGKEIYFGCDIVMCPDYEYSEPRGYGYIPRKLDLLFTIEEGFFGNKIKILSELKGHGVVCLEILFSQNGTYDHKGYYKNLEIVGNIYENK